VGYFGANGDEDVEALLDSTIYHELMEVGDEGMEGAERYMSDKFIDGSQV
jgi:hypothetical protein